MGSTAIYAGQPLLWGSPAFSVPLVLWFPSDKMILLRRSEENSQSKGHQPPGSKWTYL
ncbi:hypothetical protein CSUI_008117 [Cystoisospora suis]|uniref:Uncharacterized protein n=1 Tax=Cystoisospora suis TaxID=483139 RepID=A0A2C6KNK5_9APIC|nr:hypothetical protein CSUI_008117 [Cystoisospora suis]